MRTRMTVGMMRWRSECCWRSDCCLYVDVVFVLFAALVRFYTITAPELQNDRGAECVVAYATTMLKACYIYFRLA